MNDTADLGLVFSGVFVQSSRLAIVLAVMGKLVDQNVDHTFVFYRFEDTWYVHKTGRAITSACFPKGEAVEMVLLSADGVITRLVQGDEIEEVIDSSDDGPSELVIMRHLAVVDDTLFAVGMARHAYRKSRADSIWERVDDTCFARRADRTVAVGFNSADGFSATDVYAVGYKGEIWTFDGTSWRNRTSPTNVLLTSVACDRASLRVIIAGLAGTILIGRDDTWEELQQTETKADFWGMTCYAGSVFLSSDDGVFELRGSTFRRVNFGANKPGTTSYISSGEGVMWSVGAKDIVETRSLPTWAQIPNP